MTPALDISLQTFDPVSDLPRLRRWLQQPHVTRWWGDPEEAWNDAQHRAPENHVLITAGGEPIGYLCWETPPPNDLAAAGLAGLPDALVDADILLGEPAYLGRGIGPRAGQLLLERFQQSGTASTVGISMSVENRRSMRAAEKLGFRLFRQFDDPVHGRCQYMTLDVPGSTPP